MDLNDGTLDGFVYMFSIQPEYLMEPETWISGLSQSAWSCSAGMGMAITYSVYMRKDEDTTLNSRNHVSSKQQHQHHRRTEQ